MKMDEILNERQQDLQRGEELLQLKQCLGCMHEGVIVTGLDGTILETSPAADHILEIPSLELKSRNIRDFCVVPDIYDDMCNHASRETGSLNRSLLVSTGTGKKRLLNMVLKLMETDEVLS